jgi:hypothetical protein
MAADTMQTRGCERVRVHKSWIGGHQAGIWQVLAGIGRFWQEQDVHNYTNAAQATNLRNAALAPLSMLFSARGIPSAIGLTGARC